MPRHHVSRGGAPSLIPVGFEGRSLGFAEVAHVDDRTGAVHAAIATASLAAQGSVALHLHSYEQYVFVLEGAVELTLNGSVFALRPNDCACIPVGAVHGLRNAGSEACRWLDLKTPIPRMPGRPADTFFVEAQPAAAAPRGLRDPAAPHFNTFHPEQMALNAPSAGGQGQVAGSANLGTALQVFGGTTLRMLIDHRQGAFLGTMFMIQFQPGMVLQPHDHPIEEFFCMLDGECHFTADGKDYLLEPGDVAFAGVGCIHGFANRTDRPFRFLEARSPLPPLLHEARFGRDWDDVLSRTSVGGTAPP